MRLAKRSEFGELIGILGTDAAPAVWPAAQTITFRNDWGER